MWGAALSTGPQRWRPRSCGGREQGRVERLRLEVKIEQKEGRGSRKRLEACLERCGVLEEQLGRDEVPA